MSAKKKNTKKESKQKRNTNLPIIIVAVIIVFAAVIAVTVMKSPKVQEENVAETDSSLDDSLEADTSESGLSDTKEPEIIGEGENLEIPVDEIGESAQFYPVEVDGTNMEIIAVKDSNGNVRTAFNTCQVCYSSGRGYYVQQGDDLVCQNCGNHYTVDMVETEAGGCNPYPIFEENKTVEDNTILISYDFLKEATAIFENWKI